MFSTVRSYYIILLTLVLLLYNICPLWSSIPDSLLNEAKHIDNLASRQHYLENLLRDQLLDIKSVKPVVRLIESSGFSLPINLKLQTQAYAQIKFKKKNEQAFKKLNEIQNKAMAKNLSSVIAYAYIAKAELALFSNEYEETLSLLSQARSYAKDDVPILSYIHSFTAKVYFGTSNYNKSISHCDSSIALKRVKPDYYYPGSLLLRGRNARQLGKMDECRYYYAKAAEYAKANKFFVPAGRALNNLGNIEHIIGNYAKALQHYVHSHELKVKTGDKRGIVVALFNIGSIYVEMGEYDKALVQINKSKAAAEEVEYVGLIIRCTEEIGLIKRIQKKYNEAIQAHQEVLAYSQNNSNKRGTMVAYYELGEDYRVQSIYNQALDHYEQGLSIAGQIKHKEYESAILTGIAKSYIEQNLEIDNIEFKKSTAANFNNINIEKYLQRALGLADEIENAEHKLAAFDALQSYYKFTGESRLRAETLDEFMSLKDSLFKKENAIALADWETKYNTTEKEKEIIQLKADQEIAALKSQKIKIRLISGMLLLLISGLTAFYFWRQKQEEKKRTEREKFRSKLSSELHDDVGSILTGLAMQTELMEMYVDENHTSDVQNIGKMSRIAMERMRDTIWAIDARKDTYADLKDRILDFSNDILRPIGKTSNFNFSGIESSEKIRPDIRQSIYLIYKEAVTNIAKYSNTQTVECQISEKQNNLELHIRDYGKVDEQSIKTSGTGLSNMKMRTEKVGGTFKYFIDKGFHIQCLIPIK